MFQRRVNGDAPGTTYAIAPDGSGLRELLSTYDCCPVVSRDGTRVMVSVLAPDSKRYTTAMVGTDGTGYVDMQLPDATINLDGIAWGPDGVAAFAGWDDVNPSHGGIYVGDPSDPGSIKQITTIPVGGNAWPLVFSPDGSRLAYVRGVTADAENGVLVVVDVDGTHDQRVSPFGYQVSGDAGWGPSASWSPDGQRIALAAVDAAGCGCELYVVDADGTNPTQIFRSTGLIFGAHWSPDGQWIAFESTPAGSSWDQVMLIHPDGTGLKTITGLHDPTGSWDPHWSPDGARLLFQHGTGGADGVDLWTANADGSDLAQLTDSLGRYGWYDWAP